MNMLRFEGWPSMWFHKIIFVVPIFFYIGIFDSLYIGIFYYYLDIL
jgi:hypothetical protein